MSLWMRIQWILLALALPVSGYFFRSCRWGRAQRAYCVILFFGYVWALGELLLNCIYLYWPNEQHYWRALCFSYLGLSMMAPSCVYLAWCYAGKHKHYHSPIRVCALFGMGVLFYSFIITNNLHHLYYTDFSLAGRTYNVVFYLFTGFSYICVVYAYLIIRRTQWATDESSSLAVFISYMPLVVSNTWGMILHSPVLDFIVISYCIMVAGVYLLIWRYKPVGIVPIAAKKIFDDMGYPVRVLTPENEQLYHNGMREAKDRTYQLAETLLTDGNLMRMQIDTTSYDQARKALETQQQQLQHNQARLSAQALELKQQVEIAAELAAYKKRVEIMSTLDAEVRGALEKLREHTEMLIDTPTPEGIIQGRTIAHETLETVRRIVSELKRSHENGI